MPSTASGFEIAWIIAGLIWASMTAWGSWTAWGDYRRARTYTAEGPQVQRDILDRARTDMRYELSSLFGALLIIYLGVRAALLPSPVAVPEIWAQVGAVWALLYALVKTAVSLSNRLTRRGFDQRFAHKEHT